MPGVTLSRWTMAYFAFALLSLLGAEGLMVLGFGFPAADIAAPETLVLVHLIAIGWLSLLVCGALFQFVPVLVARPLYSNALALPTLACLVAGLALLLLGFLQLAGTVTGAAWSLLPLGGGLLGLGFALVLWNLGCTLWLARPLALPARFVAVGLTGLAATAVFGIVFTLVLGGLTASPALALLTAEGLPLHMVAGLGGWLTFTAMGVSYRLLAMFMLAPDREGATTRAAFRLGAVALAVAILGGTLAIWSGSGLGWTLLVAGLLCLGALGLYGWDVVQLYRRRKRRVIELNSRMAGIALANLAVAVLLGIVLVGAGLLGRHGGTLLFFIVFGWLSGLGLAKLYKIMAFLTWLESYGPVLGKAETPRVQDLVVEQRASRFFLLYFAGVWGATLALLADAPGIFRVGAAAMVLATVAIAAELVRIRRLADVRRAIRLPEGARRPRLLVSMVQHA